MALWRTIGRKLYIRQAAAQKMPYSDASEELKTMFAKKLAAEQAKIADFRSKHGKKKVGEIAVNQIYGGMRNVECMLCETSLLDAQEGIRYRGLTIPEMKAALPKAPDGGQPLPEGIFWLLLMGEVPTAAQAKMVSRIWAERADVPTHVISLLNNLPNKVHPMSQLSAALAVSSSESHFYHAYQKGVHKNDYWKYAFEDALDCTAKLPVIAATIYRNTYKDGSGKLPPIDTAKDWCQNFTTMLGYDNPEFIEAMRLYLTLHCDHEGANVSAHATHLVGSTLSDPYLSLAAGMNGLAGPLHGLATAQTVVFLKKIQRELGERPKEDELKEFVWKTIKAGQVIPGYGHSVLRKTDPRYSALREFCLKHFPEDSLFRLVSKLYTVVPPILSQLGKVQNPWPNIDCHVGVLMHHYGITEMNYYTVLYGLSRSLGVMAQYVWSRGLNLPIERPKSITTEALIKRMSSA